MTEISEKKSPFDYFLEILGWLQIAASPLAIAILLGGVIFFIRPGRSTLFIAILLVAAGLMIGIVWATRVWRKKGTINYLSRIMATPDLEKEPEPVSDGLVPQQPPVNTAEDLPHTS